ncbi:MAG: bifunctional metallophosphatase/5'-nucleotidase, partial [Actinobacteria bacterium]|nr:bifunctional metallophosphatase/5'-nucleotidase [Actinomycetota bacterium]NIX51828.1 bifunctional metallophosphatase/5'-nucleotidase [Actinomycetota bacterium]
MVPQLGTPLFPDPGTKLIQPYHIEHFNGDAVAFVGIDIAQKTQVSSQPFDTTPFLDEVTTAQNQINMLTAMGYDKIGLVTHQGYGNDIDLASMVSGVDFIVGGDSHTLVGDHSALGIGGTGDYPTITTDLSGNTTCIVQAWEYSKVVGNLNVQFDADGNVVSC